jgi:hypothetical protein
VHRGYEGHARVRVANGWPQHQIGAGRARMPPPQGTCGGFTMRPGESLAGGVTPGRSRHRGTRVGSCASRRRPMAGAEPRQRAALQAVSPSGPWNRGRSTVKMHPRPGRFRA